MPKFIVETNFQFYGIIRRADSTIEVSEAILQAEMNMGTKEVKSKSGNVTIRPLSGLLNHCTPADKETAEMVGKEAKKPEATEFDNLARIAEIKELMDEMGKAYDNRWKLKRFEEELTKARISTGA